MQRWRVAGCIVGDCSSCSASGWRRRVIFWIPVRLSEILVPKSGRRGGHEFTNLPRYKSLRWLIREIIVKYASGGLRRGAARFLEPRRLLEDVIFWNIDRLRLGRRPKCCHSRSVLCSRLFILMNEMLPAISRRLLIYRLHSDSSFSHLRRHEAAAICEFAGGIDDEVEHDDGPEARFGSFAGWVNECWGWRGGRWVEFVFTVV